jgi:hypothetical protein
VTFSKMSMAESSSAGQNDKSSVLTEADRDETVGFSRLE